ncbi:hypothetical protein [Kutzneria sp. 744]|uniref:hypothetical protein n=1 Tax=Kutzneria sp. (strain 744) TaxID=345341 RepID=UPI0003EEDE9D|nr:hypothetical protein [Kutzneria sp. 744]EWM19775.1 hypothetical protein KUTG_10079 [Kutzneria sp. 744]
MTTMLQHLNIADTTPISTPHGQPLRYVGGGAQGHLWALDMPPLHVAHVHSHAVTDTILFVRAGHGLTLLGEELDPIVHHADDVLVIPAGRLHVGINLSARVDFELLEFRTDAPDALDVHLAHWVQSEIEQLARRAQDAVAAGQDPVAAIRRNAA